MSRCCSAISASASSHAAVVGLFRGEARAGVRETPFPSRQGSAEQRRKVGALSAWRSMSAWRGLYPTLLAMAPTGADAHAHGMKLEPGSRRGTEYIPLPLNTRYDQAEGAGAQSAVPPARIAGIAAGGWQVPWPRSLPGSSFMPCAWASLPHRSHCQQCRKPRHADILRQALGAPTFRRCSSALPPSREEWRLPNFPARAPPLGRPGPPPHGSTR